jgi:RNA-splicing ligase RtcB
MKNMKLHEVERFETIHNYIDTENMILRKGSVSAQDGEKLIIPINMRDGSLICIGKGNSDWNYSAPHGAGRLKSRSEAKESISMSEYKKSMEGIFTTCVNNSTIDESPMAYKPMQEIVDNIQDTVEIIEVIKPIYNFKASE